MSMLDLHDIQGSILKPYGRYGFPKARFLFFRVDDGERGRGFVRRLVSCITASTPWAADGSSPGTPAPAVTTNVAFTYRGLRALGIPRDSLQSFPDEFAMGMRDRRDILGDDGKSAPEHWDPIWQSEEPVHILIWINGQTLEEVDKRHREIRGWLVGDSQGVQELVGHRGPGGRDDLAYQDGSAIYIDGKPSAKEHFGYTDGISNPFFKGMNSHESNVLGGGKVTGRSPHGRDGWEPLETGEFLLGYKDEAKENPEAPSPELLARNGTYLVYRKLHQNVGSFDRYLNEVGNDFPGGKEALAAKFTGRWRNGAPITTFPTEREADEFGARWLRAKEAIVAAPDSAARLAAKKQFGELNAEFTAFDYTDDLAGGRCPIGSHIRRSNPRGSLELGQKGAFDTPGALSNRRRILRRGVPYGDSSKERVDSGDHGVIFMALNASIRRQFEFVQQQWMIYGNDFRLANDKDPIAGNHADAPGKEPDGRMVIQTGPRDTAPPFICSRIPRFVETRGGDYFFMPSLTALRMIGDGSIDPT